MSVSEKLMGLGSFSVTLKTSAPVEAVETIDAAGHILIFQQRVDPTVMSDADMRAAAAYVGVVVSKPRQENLTIRGHGLIWWLGDGSGRGLILRDATKQAFVTSSFNNAITTVLGVTNSPLNAGSVESPAGTFTQTFDLVTQRRAIEEICAAFGAEYRVNSDWTVDAGASGFLFVSTPTVVIARHFSGKDPLVTGLPIQDVTSEQDIEEWIATAIVAAEGTGDTLQTAEDTVSPIPFKDPLGNDFNREMVFNSPSLPAGEAATRATELMEEFSVEEKIVKLNLADFHVSGDFEVGDLVYVWDTDHKLYDTANEVTFRGQLLNPIAIRVVGTQWRVIEGMGVLYRDKDGVYTDLTDHVSWERPTGTRLEVGSSSRNLVNQESEALDARITLDPDGNDTLTPNAPAHSGTPWATSTYSDDEGARTSQIIATWTEPTNTDSSVITDGSHYTIRWRRDADTDYSYFSVPWDTEVAVVNGLVPGGIYEISVEAADVNGNLSGYATDETVTAAAQVGVPSTPAAPTVAGNTLNVQVSHDLTKSGGGDLEDDLDHLVVYGDTSSGFTPSNANRLGALTATKAHIDLGITVVDSYPFPDTTNRFFVVTAVNKAGGESAKSAEASVSATLIDTQHITDLAVTTAKIGLLAVDTAQIALLAVDTAQIEAAAITNAKIDALAVDTAEIAALAVTGAKIDNATIGAAKIIDLTADKITAGTIGTEVIKLSNSSSSRIESNDGTSLIIRGNGSAVFTDITATGQIDATTGTLTTLNVDGTLTMVSGGVFRTASSGIRVEMTKTDNEFISFYSASERIGTFGWSSVLSRFLMDGVNGNTIGLRADGLVFNSDVTGASFTNETGMFIDVGVGGGAGDFIVEIDAAGSGDFHVVTGGSVRFAVENDGDVKVNGDLQVGNGSAASPSHTFYNDTNVGVYRIGENQLGFSVAGVRRFSVEASSVKVGASVTGNPQMRSDAAGSITIPAYSFVGDSNTGMYRFTTDEIGLTAGGEIMFQGKEQSGTNEVRSLPVFSGTDGTAAFVRVTSTGLMRRDSSARGLKKNIKDAQDDLAAIPIPPPQRFKWRANPTSEKADDVDPKQWRYGWIADQWADSLPEAAMYDEDGSPSNYELKAVAALTAAHVIALEDEVADLRSEIEALKEAA